MRQITDKEIADVFSLAGRARFQRFVERVADGGKAWGLWSDGWAMLDGPEETKVLPLWPDAEYADLCRLDGWRSHDVKAIRLDELLDELLLRVDAEQILLGVFPRPDDDDTIKCNGKTLARAIRIELESH